MKRTFTGLVLLLAMCLTGCGRAKLSFQEFNAPDGSYSIQMPGTPQRATSAAVGSEGWEVVSGGRWNFGVVTFPLPQAANLDSSQVIMLLNDRSQASISSQGGSVISSSDVNVNGFPGKEIHAKIPAGLGGTNQSASTAVMRFYMVNSKMMFLMARSSYSINKDTPEVKTFYDSFKLNATAPPPTTNSSSSPMPGAVAGMPAAAPPAPAGQSAVAGIPGINQVGGAPASATVGTFPVAGVNGANPGTVPPPGTFAPPGTAPAGTAPPGAIAGPNGVPYPFPGPAGATTPTSTVPNSAAGYAAGNFNVGGNNAGTTPTVPNSAAGYASKNPNGAAGTTPNSTVPNSAAGYSIPGVGGAIPPGAFPNGGVGGQTGAGPNFTGTPVTGETKINVGDMLQVYFNGQWIDVKVQRVALNGMVQVRSQTKPPITDAVPRSVLQIPPGAGDTEVASKDTPRSTPSGLPNSNAAGLPNSNATAQSKPKSSGFTKPAATAPDSKADSNKSSAGASLDDASVEELLKIIAKKTEHRRVLAAEKLKDHRDAGPNADVAKKLLDLLQADQLTVRNAVAQALEKWACPEVNDAVLKNVKGGTTEVRQSMMRILAAHYVEGNADAIAQCLVTQDDRKVATEVLISIGEPAQGAVLKMLDHRDSKVKVTACDILKDIGSADALAALTKATNSWSGTDRLAARKALKAVEARK